MSAELTAAKAAAESTNRLDHTLQANATSTAAGDIVTITQDGGYIFSADGTFGTATPTLYAKRAGGQGFEVVRDIVLGNNAVIDTSGGSIVVYLSAGDQVYSQTPAAGGGTDYNATLNRTFT